jgi:inhibitor of KinA sporulation pathway (predicted exonuclease)
MNYNNICVFDFETGNKIGAIAPILQVGAAILNRNTLKVIDTFEMKMKPEPDQYEFLDDETLRFVKITREQIETFPPSAIAWPSFVNWVNKHNKGKGGKPSPYNAPVPAGYNIIGYDMPIVRRYAQRYNVGWDDERGDQKFLSQVYFIDILQEMWSWFENNKDLPNLKLDTIREYMGFSQESKDGAHDALNDVMDTTAIIVRLFKMKRYMTELREDGTRRLEMKGCMLK